MKKVERCPFCKRKMEVENIGLLTETSRCMNDGCSFFGIWLPKKLLKDLQFNTSLLQSSLLRIGKLEDALRDTLYVMESPKNTLEKAIARTKKVLDAS
jgi:hypothetical protein